MGDDKVNIFDRLIVAKNTNENINISPTSTLTNVTGNLRVQGTNGLTYVTGYVVVDGNYLVGTQINLGDATSDLIDFNSEINSDVVPETADDWRLSNSQEKWGFLHAFNLTAANSTNIDGTFGGISFKGSNIFSSNNARDITIRTTAGQTQSLVSGGLSFETAIDEIDGGFSLDPTSFILDGGLASTAFTNADIVFNGFIPITESNFNNNTQNTHNPAYSLYSTGDGYIRFAGTNGIVIPSGTTAERNTEILGTTRFNTESGYLEIYNGTFWQNAIGVVALATQQDIEDDSVIYDLMLG